MMENKRLIIAIGALVLLGFGIEFLKGVDDLDVREGQRLEGSDFANIGNRNFMRSDRYEDRSYAVNTKNKRGFKLSGIESGMGKYDANGPQAKSKKAKGKLKKKKKKKKKKAKHKAPKKKSPEFIVEVYEENRKKSSPEAESSNENIGGEFIPVAEEQDNSEYEKWAALLLVRPDREETLAFIREFQSGKVEIETFYRIVNEMYLQEITEFRSLAVLATGATPSMRSYSFLTNAFANDEDRNIKSQANAELRDYQILQHLWIPRTIISALQAQEPVSVEVAANAIDSASANYLTPQARSEASEAPEVNRQYRSYFLSLLPVIELAIQRYQSSPDVVSSLTSALTRIQQLEVVAFNEEF